MKEKSLKKHVETQKKKKTKKNDKMNKRRIIKIKRTTERRKQKKKKTKRRRRRRSTRNKKETMREHGGQCEEKTHGKRTMETKRECNHWRLEDVETILMIDPAHGLEVSKMLSYLLSSAAQKDTNFGLFRAFWREGPCLCDLLG